MIHFAIIGCGHIAARHAKYINANPEAQLVGVYDIKPDRTRQLAEANGVKAYGNVEELLAEPSIDMVSICTPNGLHAQGAIRALEAGKSALVEKPMATQKADAERMIKAALDHNKSLFVVKQNRFNPPVQAVKKLMDTGHLGAVYAIEINCFWNRNADYYKNSDWKGDKVLDGGTLFTQYSHFLDVAYYLFGDMEVKAGEVINANHSDLIDFEDTGFFILKFIESGAIGTFNYTTSCFKQNMEGSITVFAENATIKIGGKYLNTIDYQATNGFDISDLPTSGPANNYGYYEGSMSNHDKMINNVVDALKGRDKIMTNAYDGLKVVEIIEKMYGMAQLK